MSEYSTNSDSENPRSPWNGVEQISSLGQENYGYQFQMPFYQIQDTADINGAAPQAVGFDPPKKAAPPSKRTRTAYSLYQKSTLEEHFEKQKYLSVHDRSRLAAQLNLSQTQVKIWFQNRRMKVKQIEAKSVLQGSRPRDVSVENTEIINRLLRHSAMSDLTRNTVDWVVAADMNGPNAEGYPHQVPNQCIPQDGPSNESFQNHQHLFEEHFLGQNFQVFQQNHSIRLRQEKLMKERLLQERLMQDRLMQERLMQQERLIQEGLMQGRFNAESSYNQYNNIQPQYLQPFYFHDPNMHVPQQVHRTKLSQNGPSGFHENTDASFIPAESFPQVVPESQGQEGYSDTVLTSHIADIVTRI